MSTTPEHDRITVIALKVFDEKSKPLLDLLTKMNDKLDSHFKEEKLDNERAEDRIADRLVSKLQPFVGKLKDEANIYTDRQIVLCKDYSNSMKEDCNKTMYDAIIKTTGINLLSSNADHQCDRATVKRDYYDYVYSMKIKVLLFVLALFGLFMVLLFGTGSAALKNMMSFWGYIGVMK